ncbi:RNA polymerase sigma factor [Mucilaginibacter sp.]|uniref:RNA polymerase sigma factor n=1 Tax=Mucilaginibacter sp. TaxID=1882438 RepID=UPI002630C102|nr:RNA polymerase sigma-70 factor [Mucilaginibacter sp.]MDB4923996.1 polymerase sigma-70 factor [Mucilaginibacter sp.]
MSKICENYLLLTEKELVESLKNGDKYAFEQLYHNYKVRIYRNLLKMVKSDEIAEELLQDLFVKIWISREKLNPEKSFRSYLFKIAENLVYDFFRKAALNKKLETYLISVSVPTTSPIEQHIYYKEGNYVLAKAIEQLPPKRKQVYILCKIEGRSYEEVSRLLGVSVSTVNEHIVKASSVVKKYFLLSTNIS